jgi:hypothetical protein
LGLFSALILVLALIISLTLVPAIIFALAEGRAENRNQ